MVDALRIAPTQQVPATPLNVTACLWPALHCYPSVPRVSEHVLNSVIYHFDVPRSTPAAAIGQEKVKETLAPDASRNGEPDQWKRVAGGRVNHMIPNFPELRDLGTHRVGDQRFALFVVGERPVQPLHQTHIGKYGGEMRFPDEWTGTPTINQPKP